MISSNDDKGMQSVDSIETFAHIMSKDLVCEKKEVKYYIIIKQYKKV